MVSESDYKNVKVKQYLECNLTLDHSEKILTVQPTQEDLESMFEDIVNRSVVRLCRNHKKISTDLKVLTIIYETQDQFPKESDSDILKMIMTSDDRQEKMMTTLTGSLNVSYAHIMAFAHRFNTAAKANFDNLGYMKEIDSFTGKDHEKLKNLLQAWQEQRESISLMPV